MNYYEHHIKDYAAATDHLSWDEDMAYTRLIRRYYRKEEPLPADVAEVCRLARATTKVQKDAVKAVLDEFFDLRADGWHNDVCDQVIAKYRAGEPEREAKRRNEDTRLSRHREERARLFAIINEAGQHLPWNVKMEDLRAAAARIQNGNSNGAPATPATAPATPATATHTPDTTTQTPTLDSSGGVPAAPPPAFDLAPTPAPLPAAKPAKPAKAPKEEPPTNAVWQAYSEAYTARYHAAPVRNATVNGKLAQFVNRIPQAEACNVARFFLACTDALYIAKCHPVGLLLQDAETLRTRWATARTTIEAAPQSDRARRMAAALAPLGIRTAATPLPKEDLRAIAH